MRLRGDQRDVARERDGRGEQGTALKSEKRVRVEVDVDVRVVYELGGGGDEEVSRAVLAADERAR